jgi:hypothetical protein
VPSPASSVHLFRNGILQKASVDYWISANVVTFSLDSTPQIGDLLLASYRVAAP